MATVRCPRCGTVNPNGRRRLARCRRCREPLGKCRYCKHYDFQMLDCTHTAREPGVRVADADEVLNCTEFSSTLVTSGVERQSLLRLVGKRSAVAAGLVVAVAVAMICVWHYSTRPTAPAELQATLSAPAVSLQDEGFEVTVLVQNEAQHPAREVKVVIAGPSLRHLTCQYVEPPEAFLEASPRMVSAQLGDLDPGDIGSVAFGFAASETGELALSAYVAAANVEGTQSLPIEGEVVP